LYSIKSPSFISQKAHILLTGPAAAAAAVVYYEAPEPSLFSYSLFIFFVYVLILGHVVAQLVETQRYKPGRSQVRFPMVEFFICVILPAAPWSWSLLSL
jgi:hypothetical protein